MILGWMADRADYRVEADLAKSVAQQGYRKVNDRRPVLYTELDITRADGN
jgi:hypothetical protein